VRTGMGLSALRTDPSRPTKPGSGHLGLEKVDRELKMSPAEFDEVASELGRTLEGRGGGPGRRVRAPSVPAEVVNPCRSRLVSLAR
jgi:hypothetical protein